MNQATVWQSSQITKLQLLIKVPYLQNIWVEESKCCLLFIAICILTTSDQNSLYIYMLNINTFAIDVILKIQTN